MPPVELQDDSLCSPKLGERHQVTGEGSQGEIGSLVTDLNAIEIGGREVLSVFRAESGLTSGQQSEGQGGGDAERHPPRGGPRPAP